MLLSKGHFIHRWHAAPMVLCPNYQAPFETRELLQPSPLGGWGRITLCLAAALPEAATRGQQAPTGPKATCSSLHVWGH